MSEHDLEKLLGGFAANTLTPEERQVLYAAALQDQSLFNALADEQALKELLADPQVRQALLAALERQKSKQSTGGSSWMVWFRRPTNLALAGGLASAVIAILLGTKIYQDSLKQAAPSAVTEKTAPAAPPASVTTPPTQPTTKEPQQRTNEITEPVPDAAKKDALMDKATTREKAAKLSAPKEKPAADLARDQAASLRQENAPQTESAKAQEQPAAVPEPQPQALRAPSAPPTSELKRREPTATSALAGAVTPRVSARALFYGTPSMEQEPPSRSGIAKDIRPGAQAPANAPLVEQKDRSSALLGKLERAKQSVEHPLGIRYSLIMAGPGGIDMEVDPTTPVGKDDAPRLAVQTNEDGYLSVLDARPSSDKPTVLFPSSGDGRVTRRTTMAIALEQVFDAQQTAEQIRLLVFFSRTPRDISSPLPTEKHAPRLLIEQVDPSQPGAPAEQAVYVVNADPASAAALWMEILLSLRP